MLRPAASERTSLILGIVALFAAFPLLPKSAVVAVAVPTVALTAVGWGRRERAAVHVGLFCSLCFAAMLAGIRLSQLWLGLAIVLYAVAVRGTPWLRGTVGWARLGGFGRDVQWLCGLSVLVASAALVVWFVTFRPDVDDLRRTFLPDLHPALLILGGVFFSIVNAAVEEIAYRGVVMEALQACFGPGLAALSLQAVAFGTLHINGFPRGWIGVGLACVYGLMMGAIRMRARGMLAPWAAHVLTDMTIVGILVLLARG